MLRRNKDANGSTHLQTFGTETEADFVLDAERSPCRNPPWSVPPS